MSVATFYQFDGPSSRDARCPVLLHTARALVHSFAPPGVVAPPLASPEGAVGPVEEGVDWLPVAAPGPDEAERHAVLLPGTKWLHAESGLDYAKGDEAEAGRHRFIVSIGDHGILNKPNMVGHEKAAPRNDVEELARGPTRCSA